MTVKLSANKKYFGLKNIPSFRYRWEKNGKPFNWQVYSNRMLEQPGRGTLVITSPRTEDIGEMFSRPVKQRLPSVKSHNGSQSIIVHQLF